MKDFSDREYAFHLNAIDNFSISIFTDLNGEYMIKKKCIIV